MRIPDQPQPIICHVLHSLNVGGAEVLAARLARRLQGAFGFVFACLDDLGPLGEQLRAEGFVVDVISRRSGMDLRCVRRLAAFLHKHDVAVIHAHQYTPFFYSRAPGWIGRRRPVLFTEHGRFYPDNPNPKRMVFNRLFLRRQDRVVAVGEAVKRALVNNEAIPPRLIDVIHNGVNVDDFSPDCDERRRVRGELGIGPDVPVAVQVARLDYLKAHGTALNAAARVRERLPEFQLLLVGDGPERPKIEADIAAMQLSNTVRLLGMRTDIRGLLSAADVFLLTSISEGIPVTLIEAMCAELPVVSSEVGGVGEVVASGETGLLAAAGDDVRLAEAMVRILTDLDLRRSLGVQGRIRAAGLFSESTMHDRYAALYYRMSRRPAVAAMAG